MPLNSELLTITGAERRLEPRLTCKRVDDRLDRPTARPRRRSGSGRGGGSGGRSGGSGDPRGCSPSEGIEVDDRLQGRAARRPTTPASSAQGKRPGDDQREVASDRREGGQGADAGGRGRPSRRGRPRSARPPSSSPFRKIHRVELRSPATSPIRPSGSPRAAARPTGPA